MHRWYEDSQWKPLCYTVGWGWLDLIACCRVVGLLRNICVKLIYRSLHVNDICNRAVDIVKTMMEATLWLYLQLLENMVDNMSILHLLNHNCNLAGHKVQITNAEMRTCAWPLLQPPSHRPIGMLSTEQELAKGNLTSSVLSIHHPQTI